MILSTDDVHEYVLECDKGKEKPTTFLIKERTVKVSALMTDGSTSANRETGDIKILVGTSQLIQLCNCVVGWKNVFDKEGKEIEFKTELIEKLPSRIMAELNRFINIISNVSRDEEKN